MKLPKFFSQFLGINHSTPAPEKPNSLSPTPLEQVHERILDESRLTDLSDDELRVLSNDESSGWAVRLAIAASDVLQERYREEALRTLPLREGKARLEAGEPISALTDDELNALATEHRGDASEFAAALWNEVLFRRHACYFTLTSHPSAIATHA